MTLTLHDAAPARGRYVLSDLNYLWATMTCPRYLISRFYAVQFRYPLPLSTVSPRPFNTVVTPTPSDVLGTLPMRDTWTLLFEGAYLFQIGWQRLGPVDC
jgi:hypothetical protein